MRLAYHYCNIINIDYNLYDYHYYDQYTFAIYK